MFDTSMISALAQGIVPMLPVILGFVAILLLFRIVIHWIWAIGAAWSGASSGELSSNAPMYGADGAGGAMGYQAWEEGVEYWNEMDDAGMVATGEDGEATWQKKMRMDGAGESGDEGPIFSEFEGDDEDDESEWDEAA